VDNGHFDLSIITHYSPLIKTAFLVMLISGLVIFTSIMANYYYCYLIRRYEKNEQTQSTPGDSSHPEKKTAAPKISWFLKSIADFYNSANGQTPGVSTKTFFHYTYVQGKIKNWIRQRKRFLLVPLVISLISCAAVSIESFQWLSMETGQPGFAFQDFGRGIHGVITANVPVYTALICLTAVAIIGFFSVFSLEKKMERLCERQVNKFKSL